MDTNEYPKEKICKECDETYKIDEIHEKHLPQSYCEDCAVELELPIYTHSCGECIECAIDKNEQLTGNPNPSNAVWDVEIYYRLGYYHASNGIRDDRECELMKYMMEWHMYRRGYEQFVLEKQVENLKQEISIIKNERHSE